MRRIILILGSFILLNINVKALSLHQKEEKLNDTVFKQMNNKDFSLKIASYLLNDTLDIDDYKNNKYSNPIILGQDLYFFKKELLLKKYKLPIKEVEVKTITNLHLSIINTPIHKLCLAESSKEEFYIVSGAFYDYCNGVECPEFIGIYSMMGETLYEGYTTEKKKIPLQNVIDEYGIQLNKIAKCEKVDSFYKN